MTTSTKPKIADLRAVVDAACDARRWCCGGTTEEFKRQKVGPALSVHRDAIKALVFPARFSSDADRRDREVERLSEVIAKWEAVQALQAGPTSPAPDRKFKKGDKVRLSAAFLKSTGQHRGSEGTSTWTVLGVLPYGFVYVDEGHIQGYWTAEDIEKDPSLRWRHFAEANLVLAGRPDTTGL